MLKRISDKIVNKLQTKSKMKKFIDQFTLFKEMDVNKKLKAEDEDFFYCLQDNTETTIFDAHYIYHPAWAARIIRDLNPSKHIDISSTLHFSSILSAFIKTEFYDYRPAYLQLDNLYTGKADLTNLFFDSNSLECISCMHTIEHIGLGRYGDPIDPDGDVKAINELIRVTKKGGSILFASPVGKPRIMFNAHRIYSAELVIKLFEKCELKQFSLVTDQNDFLKDPTIEIIANQNYGCGCFWFIKK